jgi:hypothetical protein
MPGVATEIRVAANGQVYVAPTSATAPTDISTSLDTWSQLGFVSEQGARLIDAKAYEEVDQKDRPAREIPTGRHFLVAFSMRQWNGFNVMLAFSGTVTPQGNGRWKFAPTWSRTTPPDERSMVIDWQDSGKNFRLYIPRGVGSASTEPEINRTSPADLVIVFEALGETPWKLYTDDPSFAAPTLKSHTIDAHVRVIGAQLAHTVDALSVYRFTRTNTVDAYVLLLPQRSHTVDAVVQETGQKTHTVDAVVATGGWGANWGANWGG